MCLVYYQRTNHEYFRNLDLVLFFNFIDNFLLTNQIRIIRIKESITFDSFWYIIEIYKNKKRTKNKNLWCSTGYNNSLRKNFPQID